MKKHDLKLIGAFIADKNPKQELNFAKVGNGAIYATDARTAIQFNVDNIAGNSLVHKKLFKGLESIVGKDERLHFKDGYLHTDSVKFSIDTGYFVEDENGKHKIGAKALDYPNVKDIVDMQLPHHFALDDINDLQFELAQKNCYIDDIYLNPIISYNDCSMFDIYYKPQRLNEKENIETGTVKIVAQKADDDGVVFTQFIAVVMGRTFESKAKQEF